MFGRILKKRFPLLASSLYLLSLLPQSRAKHRVRSRGGRDYHNMEVTLGGAVPVYDAATAFFLRAVLEVGYMTVIEIGTFNGSRILTLKRLVPAITGYGLDIPKTFAQPFDVEGVRFELFDNAFFKVERPQAIVLSRATLCCFKREELDAFIATLGGGGYDLALCEPVLAFEFDTSLQRSKNTYYHPYPMILRNAGFHLDGSWQRVTKYAFSLGMTEAWYHNVACL